MKTEPLLEEAKKISLEAGKASVSRLQSKLGIGHGRAVRIIDTFIEQGFCESDFRNDIGGRRIVLALNTDMPMDTGNTFRFCDVANKSENKKEKKMKEQYKPLFSNEELNTVQSRLAIAMGKGIKTKTSSTDYENMAIKIGEEYGITKEELLSEVGKCRHYYSSLKPKNKKNKKNAPIGISEKYEQWCTKKTFVPSDDEIVFWTNCTLSGVKYARNRLEEIGYRFDKTDNGYSVTSPPSFSYEEKLQIEKAAQLAVAQEMERILRNKGKNI